jgi:hypothetical protein
MTDMGVKTSYQDVTVGRLDGRTCPLAIGRVHVKRKLHA